jgi:hypothetical protein
MLLLLLASSSSLCLYFFLINPRMIKLINNQISFVD